MKLQLLIAKLNSNLEDQSEHILQSMPRVVREVESLQQEAALLKSSMSAVQSDIDKVNKETGDSMACLVKMDLLKQRMQATKNALKEADNCHTQWLDELFGLFHSGESFCWWTSFFLQPGHDCVRSTSTYETNRERH